MRTRLTLFALAFTLTGCSYFQRAEHLDLAPFAERTVSLAADIEYGMTKGGSAHYLREYRTDPVVVAHNEQWNEVRRLLRGVVAYSVEISTLGASKMPSPERNQRFATFLDRLIRPVLEEEPAGVRFSIQDLDDMLAAIKDQVLFLDALREAQPFIDEVARLADLLFDTTQDALTDVADYLYGRIEADNAGPVDTWDRLIKAQDGLFTSIDLTRTYKIGHDPAVLATLYENEIDYPEWAANPAAPTTDELNKMLYDIVGKLKIGLDLKDLLRPDLEHFAAQQQELDRLYVGAQIQLKKARVTIMIWAKAHRNLSEGVTDAAKIDIFDITKKAVRTAL